METSDRRVSRLDRSGVRETTGFVESSGDLMAVTTTVPQAPRAGLIMYPSLFTEALRNYRREVVLSRAMAANGIAVQRLQYRGTGNSDDVDISRDTVVTDARHARELLQNDTGITQLAFAGTRFGALVAATVAAEAPGAPLMLIEPIEDARRFLDDGLRAKVISTFRASTPRATKASLVDELERDGWIELLGSQLGLALYQSAEGWSLQEEIGSTPRPILLVQLDADQPLRPEYEALVAAWRNDGFDVESVRLGSNRTWWFLHEQIEEGRKIRQKGLTESDELVSCVTEWLDRTMVSGARR